MYVYIYIHIYIYVTGVRVCTKPPSPRGRFRAVSHPGVLWVRNPPPRGGRFRARTQTFPAILPADMSATLCLIHYVTTSFDLVSVCVCSYHFVHAVSIWFFGHVRRDIC